MTSGQGKSGWTGKVLANLSLYSFRIISIAGLVNLVNVLCSKKKKKERKKKTTNNLRAHEGLRKAHLFLEGCAGQGPQARGQAFPTQKILNPSAERAWALENKRGARALSCKASPAT